MLKYKNLGLVFFKNHTTLFKFSSSNTEIFDRYQSMVKTGAILEDKKQLSVIQSFDVLRNTIIANQHEWQKFSGQLDNDLKAFQRRIEEEAAQKQAKTKHMFDGQESTSKFQKKRGLMGMLQSNTQPIWQPIKDHNLTSHNKISHKFNFTDLEKYNLKKHKGLYVHGEPGSGKTFLMDIFYDSIPIKEKHRFHFNQFISEISQKMKHVSDQGIQEPQKVVALQKCQGMRLLCLDEFQVTDIANALILKSLFEVFIKNNVIVVATSNRIPDDLYKGGLQRELFVPFIPFLKENTNQINVQTRDYRLLKQEKTENFFYPLNVVTQTKILDIYEKQAGIAKFETKEIEVIEGRSIQVEQCYNGVAMYTFQEIILGKYGSTDYIALSKNFHTFILTDVPEFTLDNRDALRRFITFVDIIYDSSAKLYISAAKKFEELMQIDGSNYKREDMLDEAFTGHDLYDEEFAFQRTVSRVHEMQTKSYQNKKTLYHRMLEEQQ